jgi:hypothetical protein
MAGEVRRSYANVLGGKEMTETKTDFNTWDVATLAQFARECNEQNKQLRADVKMLLKANRQRLIEAQQPKETA